MFLKLFKYDFIALMRKLAFVYIPFVLLGLILGFMSFASDNQGVLIARAILTLPFELLFIGIIIGTLILVMIRYYKTMLSDEGYLTHTLPVKKSVLLLEKIFVGFVVCLVSGVVCFFTLLLSYMFNFKDFIDGIKETLPYLDGDTILLLLSLFLLVILFLVMQLSKLACCLSIGGMSSKNKVVLGIITFVSINVVSSILYSIVGAVFLVELDDLSIAVILNIMNAYLLVIIIVYYFINLKILNSKLNLQ